MKMFTYYLKAVFYPSLFILFFSILYSIIDNINYKSDWQTDKSLVIMAIVTSLLYILLMHILSLTIFLNKIKKLNRNIIWNIATWFLFPLGYLIMVLIHDLKGRIKFSFGFGNDFIFLLIMILPFVFGLCLTFIKFRHKITAIGS